MPQSAGASATTSTGNDEGTSILKPTSQPRNVDDTQNVQQIPQKEVEKLLPEDLNKQSQKPSSALSSQCTSKSGEGLNLISKFIDVEPAKQVVNQKQKDDSSSSRPGQKDVKRKGSSSSMSALSEMIQDIRISPREAKAAAENIPTKGTVEGI